MVPGGRYLPELAKISFYNYRNFYKNFQKQCWIQKFFTESGSYPDLKSCLNKYKMDNNFIFPVLR